MAVQLARSAGAIVIGPASPANHDYLRSLGAIPIAYGDGLISRVQALAPNGIHAALDLAGGEAITASLTLITDKDRIGTTVDAKAAGKDGIRRLRGELPRPIVCLSIAIGAARSAISATRIGPGGRGRAVGGRCQELSLRTPRR